MILYYLLFLDINNIVKDESTNTGGGCALRPWSDEQDVDAANATVSIGMETRSTKKKRAHVGAREGKATEWGDGMDLLEASRSERQTYEECVKAKKQQMERRLKAPAQSGSIVVGEIVHDGVGMA